MRNFARYTTGLHRDPDFTSLTFAEQGVYFMLGMQPEVSAAGTLALTLGRWTTHAADCNRTDLEKLLSALTEHDAKHIVIDYDTEELIIRKFIKWDGGWSNSKRLPVILDAVSTVASVHIRDIAVDELRKIAAGLAHSAADADARNTLSRKLDEFENGLSRNDRLRARVNLGDHSALDLNPNPEPGAVTRAEAPPWNPKRCQKHQTTDIPGNCGGCKDARETYEATILADLDAEAEQRKAIKSAIKACGYCDANGKRVDPRTQLVVARFCDHQPLTSADDGGVA